MQACSRLPHSIYVSLMVTVVEKTVQLNIIFSLPLLKINVCLIIFLYELLAVYVSETF